MSQILHSVPESPQTRRIRYIDLNVNRQRNISIDEQDNVPGIDEKLFINWEVASFLSLYVIGI